jgi:pyruvate dehydrogenase E1 component alpha subunit
VVYAAAQEAVAHVRSGKGPYLLELMTYRYRGHSMSDSNAYRSKGEEQEWGKRDPIIILRERLIAAGELGEEAYRAMDEAILSEIDDEIIPYCESSPEPVLAELENDVLAQSDPWVMGGAH